MNGTRARTTSRNPSLRLLLVDIAFILLNIWVSLKWILGEPRRGGRYIHPKLFILSQLRLFLIEAIKEIYGITLDSSATLRSKGILTPYPNSSLKLLLSLRSTQERPSLLQIILKVSLRLYLGLIFK